MRYPQVLIHDDDGGLARALTPLAEARKPRWVLRQPRRLDACARLVMRGHPSVLVVKAGRDVNREMALIDRVCAASLDVPVVVVAVAASPTLAALAWHLGAAYVFTTEPSAEMLANVVEQLLQRASESCRGRPGPRGPQDAGAEDEAGTGEPEPNDE